MLTITSSRLNWCAWVQMAKTFTHESDPDLSLKHDSHILVYRSNQCRNKLGPAGMNKRNINGTCWEVKCVC
jgi:hypothetical protein